MREPDVLDVIAVDTTPPRAPARVEEPEEVPQKSLLWAYLFWLCLGLIGGHRFYLGRWLTGLLYLFTAGLYGLGFALDFFLLPWMVAHTNRKLREKAEREAMLEVLPVAEWTEREPPFRPLESLLRLGYFAIAPCAFAVLSLFIDLWELIVLMVVTLVVCGLLRNVNTLLVKYPALLRVPMVGEALLYL